MICSCFFVFIFSQNLFILKALRWRLRLKRTKLRQPHKITIWLLKPQIFRSKELGMPFQRNKTFKGTCSRDVILGDWMGGRQWSCSITEPVKACIWLAKAWSDLWSKALVMYLSVRTRIRPCGQLSLCFEFGLKYFPKCPAKWLYKRTTTFMNNNCR